jgi:2-oxoglutarate ferredoxin oxidoreductase subunit beta
VVEVLQNCVIFNDGIHNQITDAAYRADRQLILKHGEPMLFGENNEKGLIYDRKGKLKVVTIGEDGIALDDILVHDATEKDTALHLALIKMQLPHFPVAFGVIRSVSAPVYDIEMVTQIEEIKSISPVKNMRDLLHSGNTWVIEDNGEYSRENKNCPKRK